MTCKQTRRFTSKKSKPMIVFVAPSFLCTFPNATYCISSAFSGPVSLPVSLPIFLPVFSACLPAYLPACFPSYLPAYLPSCLLACCTALRGPYVGRPGRLGRPARQDKQDDSDDLDDISAPPFFLTVPAPPMMGWCRPGKRGRGKVTGACLALIMAWF